MKIFCKRLKIPQEIPALFLPRENILNSRTMISVFAVVDAVEKLPED